VQTTEYLPGTGARTSETTFNPADGRPAQTTEYSPMGTRTSETTFNPVDGKPVKKNEYRPGTSILTGATVYYPGTDKPRLVEVYGPTKTDDTILYKSTEYLVDGGRVERNNQNGVETFYDPSGKVSYEGLMTRPPPRIGGLIINFVGEVSSSSTSSYSASLAPFPSFNLAYADDMIGMPSATTDTATDGPPGHDGGDDDSDGDDTASTTDTITAGPTGGDRKDDGEDDDDDSDNAGNKIMGLGSV
jgi:hypothetical protein